MRRVIHLSEGTKFSVESGMLFIRGQIDQTVIIADTPECADKLRSYLGQLIEDAE